MLFAVTDLSTRPEKVGEAEEIARRMAERGRDAIPDLSWSFFEVTTGGFGRYRIVGSAPTWEALDAVMSLETVIPALFGASEVAEMIQRVRECFDALVQSVERARPELGVAGNGEPAGPVVELTRVRARPDRQRDVEAYFEAIVAAVRKVEDPRHFSVTDTLVGELGTYAMHTSVARLGDLDAILSPPELLIRAFGDREGGAIHERAQKAMQSAERLLLVRRDELSVLR